VKFPSFELPMPSEQNILKDFELRQTNSRKAVLHAFLEEDRALSGTDIEHRVQDLFDRATVYRTINTFLEKGVIHKVLDDEGATKYALCKNECTNEEHHHDHVHFKCLKCGSITCIDSIHIPTFSLPANYTVVETNLLVTGVCRICNLSSD